MEVTRSELLRNRNIWHTIAVLPPREKRERLVVTKDRLKAGSIRSRINEIEEEIRLKREFEL